MSLPLDGILVVALEHAVAAPLATRHLADLGARVIKVEPPSGDFGRGYDTLVDGMASYFVWLNRNKESVVLDFTTDQGRRDLDALIARADVVVQNLGPGAARRHGLAADQIRAHAPSLIACEITGFGSRGPFADRRAYDLVVQAESGSISITGTPEQRAKPGIAVADIAAGMYAHSAILAALLRRVRTGEGATLEVSLFDAIAEWMHYSVYWSRATGAPHVPAGIGHPALVPYGGFETADGHIVVLGCQNDREWARLAAEVLDRPDLAEHPDYVGMPNRVARRDDIHGLVAEWVGRHDFAEVAARLDAARIANGRVRSSLELLDHPNLVERDRWASVVTPLGSAPVILPPTISSAWTVPLGPVPALGQHTQEVLSELRGAIGGGVPEGQGESDGRSAP